MLPATYDTQVCSVARALEVVGERWTMLIIRDVFLGVRRFEDLQRGLGIARNTLAARLDKLTRDGILERRRYSEHPPRDEYRLTQQGRDLWPAVVALMQWGDRYRPSPGGPPTVLEHRGCGGSVNTHRTCERCGAELEVGDIEAHAGPGAPPGHPLLRRAA
jgi:DNA-binding HxlR family transcriptional regulator